MYTYAVLTINNYVKQRVNLLGYFVLNVSYMLAYFHWIII